MSIRTPVDIVCGRIYLMFRAEQRFHIKPAHHINKHGGSRDRKCPPCRPGVKDSAKETIKFNCYCRSDNNSSLAAPAGETPLRRGWKHGAAAGTLFKISEGLKSIKPDHVYVNSQLLNKKSLMQWCSEHFTGGSSAEVFCIYSTQ